MVALFKIHLSLVFLKGVLVLATYRGYALIIRIQVLSSEDFICLSYFVAAQLLRTPNIRIDMENFRQNIVDKWGEDFKVHPDDPKTVAEYGPETAKVNSLKMISDTVPDFAKLLQEKVWTLCKAPSSMPFIISDNPVVRHNMFDRGPRGNLGLRNEGIEVYMPLTPKFAIHIICPKLVNAACITPELSLSYSQALQNGTPILLKPENAEFANSLQVIWPERFVYAREKEHLELPIDMLRTNPELKQGASVSQTVYY